MRSPSLSFTCSTTAYNEERPHRALGRRTPREVYDAKVKATPQAKVETHFRIRHDKVDRHGKLSLRYDSRLLHIGVGARHKGLPVVLVATLNGFTVPKAEQDELLGILGPLKTEIVEVESSATATPLPDDYRAAPPLAKA